MRQLKIQWKVNFVISEHPIDEIFSASVLKNNPGLETSINNLKNVLLVLQETLGIASKKLLSIEMLLSLVEQEELLLSQQCAAACSENKFTTDEIQQLTQKYFHIKSQLQNSKEILKILCSEIQDSCKQDEKLGL